MTIGRKISSILNTFVFQQLESDDQFGQVPDPARRVGTQ